MRPTRGSSLWVGPMSERRRGRLALGEAVVLSVNQAVELLPIADGDAREWLRAHDLVRSLAGRSVVLWREVLAELAGGSQGEAGGARRGRSRPRPRVSLKS